VILSRLERSAPAAAVEEEEGSGDDGRGREVTDLSRLREGEEARLAAREWRDGPAEKGFFMLAMYAYMPICRFFFFRFLPLCLKISYVKELQE